MNKLVIIVDVVVVAVDKCAAKVVFLTSDTLVFAKL